MFGSLAHPFGRPITQRSLLRLDLMFVLWLALILLLLAAVVPAHAGNTTFLTDKNGNQVFPLSPPNRNAGTPGQIDNMNIGLTTPAIGNFTTTTIQQGTPATLNTTGTLTAVQINSGIITSTTAAAVAATLPLATAMDTGNPSAVATTSIDFSVINTGGSASVTMTTNTGWTLVGTMAVTFGTSGRFRATKTGVGAWTLYRLS